MWFYPLPALLATAGFVYILISRPNFLKEIRYAAVLLFFGLLLYFVRAARRGEWPWKRRPIHELGPEAPLAMTKRKSRTNRRSFSPVRSQRRSCGPRRNPAFHYLMFWRGC